MTKQAKTLALVDAARVILAEYNPMTVRQLYYQLVSRQVIENTRAQYQRVSDAIVWARQEGAIPWEWIEDRTRRPRQVPMWSDLADFLDTVRRSYRRDVWETQPAYLEVWLEKDALSGIFEAVLNRYGVTLNVGRGYDGWSSIQLAAARLVEGATVVYFGDFDPSGEDMVRSLCDRLAFFDCRPVIVKAALTYDDITRYNLPSDFAKKTDTRAAAHVKRYGDVSVELDALPAAVLQSRLIDEVEKRLDMSLLSKTQTEERTDLARLAAWGPG